MTASTAVLILAAGNSSRLGQAKQKLVFEGKSLLQRTIDTAIQSGCRRPLVVLGAYHEEILQDLGLEYIDVVVNPEWKRGMGTSIKLGLDNILEDTGVEQVLILLCDQPFVNTDLIHAMIEQKKQSGKPIIACTYAGILGVPVLFDQKFFPKLLQIGANEGAKQILLTYSDEVVTVPFPQGKTDIDTKEDFEALLSGKSS